MTKVVRWLIFGAAVSLLPLAYVYLDLTMRSQVTSLEKILGGGELLVVIWVLAASAFGELIGGANERSTLKVLVGGLTFIIIVSSAMFFSSIAEAKAMGSIIDEHFVTQISIWLFFVSLVPCCACLVV
jgi:hypothetical protein